MNLIFTIFLIFVNYEYVMSTGVPDEKKEMGQALHDLCVQQTKVDEKLIVKADQGILTNDEKLKCYMKCLFEKVGAISDDGVINYTSMLAALPESYRGPVGKAIEICRNEVEGDNGCEIVYSLYLCLHRNEPDKFFLW